MCLRLIMRLICPVARAPSRAHAALTPARPPRKEKDEQKGKKAAVSLSQVFVPFVGLGVVSCWSLCRVVRSFPSRAHAALTPAQPPRITPAAPPTPTPAPAGPRPTHSPSCKPLAPAASFEALLLLADSLCHSPLATATAYNCHPPRGAELVHPSSRSDATARRETATATEQRAGRCTAAAAAGRTHCDCDSLPQGLRAGAVRRRPPPPGPGLGGARGNGNSLGARGPQ
jgi:hypothetical protein